MENKNETQEKESEFDLKATLSTIKLYLLELKKKWKWVAIFCLLSLSWQAYKVYSTPKTYVSNLTFIVDEETTTGPNVLGALLGDFGLGVEDNNYDRILEFAKSQKIMQLALLKKVTINDKEDYLANHFISKNKIHAKYWNRKKLFDEKESALKDFYFTRDSFENFSRKEFSAFKSLYGLITGNEDGPPTFTNRYNPDSGIMSLSISTESEELSIVMLRTIFDVLSEYYIVSSTNKEKATFQIILAKSDSLKQLLNSQEIGQARFQDKSLGLVKNQDKLPNERFARNKTMLNLMYGESVKNLEIADFALKDRTPYIQAIDLPIPPLTPNTYSKKKALILGIGIGFLLASLGVFAQKFFTDSMTNTKTANPQ